MFANTQNERPSARRHADEELKNGIIISVVVIIVNYYCSPDGRERDTTDDGSAATKRTRRRVGACARTFVCFTRVVIFIRAKVQVVRARAYSACEKHGRARRGDDWLRLVLHRLRVITTRRYKLAFQTDQRSTLLDIFFTPFRLAQN